jgi:hypothetical protein
VKGDKHWKNVQSVFEIEDVDEHYYCFTVTHSGHDYPARLTGDPDTSEPPDFEINIDKIEKGYCNGDEMSRAEIDAFADKYHQELIDALMEAEK